VTSFVYVFPPNTSMHFPYSHACYIPSQPQTIMSDNIELTEKLRKETDLCFLVTMTPILKLNSVRRASTCLSLANSLFCWKSMKSAKKRQVHTKVIGIFVMWRMRCYMTRPSHSSRILSPAQ